MSNFSEGVPLCETWNRAVDLTVMMMAAHQLYLRTDRDLEHQAGNERARAPAAAAFRILLSRELISFRLLSLRNASQKGWNFSPLERMMVADRIFQMI